METKTDKPNEPLQTETAPPKKNNKKTIIKIAQIKINRKIKNQNNKFRS
jgi:hypothetical protein